MSAATIFEPAQLGPLTLSNHLVMNPMTRSRSDAKGLANALMAEYYAQRATAGLIITEGVAPTPQGKGYARIPGLWSQEQAESWKPVTAAVHAKGGRIFAQLMHTGRASQAANFIEPAQAVAPSALLMPGKIHVDGQGELDYSLPKAMSEQEVQSAKAGYVQATRNAIAAGFDGVELHGANGYLIEQFLSPHSNRRDDAWGGSVDKRIRFAVETAREAAQAVGGDKVGIRLSPFGAFNDMPAYPEIEETYLKLAAELAKTGILYLHMVDHTAQGAPAIPEGFRQALRKAWPRTFILGGSQDLASGEAALKEGRADLIGYGKAFLANPDLVKRWKEGSPLNAPDFSTLYSPGAKGYTDYAIA